MLVNLKKTELIQKFRRSKYDTGSSEVQVACLTFQINHLKLHFSTHKKDHSSRQGLLKMVARRRKLLNYLKKNNSTKYISLIESLKLRR